MSEDWYKIDNVSELDSPALVVLPEIVRKNIHTAIRMVGDVSRLRPHIKTNKSSSAISMMMKAGISKFKCATIAEAELLGICGAQDVVLAYQPLGPKLLRFISVIKKYPATSFSCLTDNMAAAKEQEQAFKTHNLQVPVFMDINLGMNRTGIRPGQEAIDLYRWLSKSDTLIAAGFHAYDGHLRDKDITERTTRCNEAFIYIEKLKASIEEKGLTVPVIIAGGSPTFPIHANRKDVECSPGTFVYWDKSYTDGCSEQDFHCAAVLITRVISFPAPGLICTDLGHKSVAAENEINRRIYFLGENKPEPVSQSEEHLVASIIDDHSFKISEVLYGIPFHVCPTVALYEKVYTVENGKVTGEWKNEARDRKITI